MNVEQKIPSEDRDVASEFFAATDGHFNDVLYINFKIYKKKMVLALLKRAIENMDLTRKPEIVLLDVGASSGVDVLYAIRCLTADFSQPLPWKSLKILLLDGHDYFMRCGKSMMKSIPSHYGVTVEYRKCALIARLPVEDECVDLAICSEVVEHLVEPEKLLAEIRRVLVARGSLVLTTDNSPSVLQYIRRIPVWLRGRYAQAYKRPIPADTIAGHFEVDGKQYVWFGHINLNPTRHWERLARQAGFKVKTFGEYQSIRRGGGSNRPIALAAYFVGGWINSLLPARLGRFFGDSTALLLERTGGVE